MKGPRAPNETPMSTPTGEPAPKPWSSNPCPWIMSTPSCLPFAVPQLSWTGLSTSTQIPPLPKGSWTIPATFVTLASLMLLGIWFNPLLAGCASFSRRTPADRRIRCSSPAIALVALSLLCSTATFSRRQRRRKAS